MKRRNIVREFVKIEKFVREFVNSCIFVDCGSSNREACHFSLIRSFVKIQNIVREFVNRTPPGMGEGLYKFQISIFCNVVYRELMI